MGPAGCLARLLVAGCRCLGQVVVLRLVAVLPRGLIRVLLPVVVAWAGVPTLLRAVTRAVLPAHMAVLAAMVPVRRGVTGRARERK